MDADGRNPRQLTNSTGFDAQPIFVSSGIVFGRAATLRQTSTGGERWIDWDVFEVDTSGQQTARRTSSKFREIGSLDLMPDGKHILVSTMEISNSVDYSLNILELSSGRRTTVGVPGDFHGSVSVNGRIAFIHDTGDYNYEVFMMDADGQNRQQITHLKSYIAAPIVSPDTKRVAFLSDKTRQGIYLLWEARLDGNELYPRQIELPE